MSFYTSMLLSLLLIIIGEHYSYGASLMPEQIIFQGRLCDTQVHPRTGNYDLKFRLYTASTGGAPIWTEIHNAHPVVDGIYNVYLGAITPLTNLTFDTQYWISLEVNNDGEMTPRSKLSSSAYCFRSRYADTASALASGGRIAGALTVSETVTAVYFVGDGGGLTGIEAQWQQDSGGISYSGGRVGIGTETPSVALDIDGTVRATTFCGDASQLTGVSTFKCTNMNITRSFTDTVDVIIGYIPANTVKHGVIVFISGSISATYYWDEYNLSTVTVYIGNDGNISHSAISTGGCWTRSQINDVIPSSENDWTQPVPIRVKFTNGIPGHAVTTITVGKMLSY